MKSILENRPALTNEVNKAAEVAGYLWQKGWAERNGGNIVVVHVNDARSCGNGGRVSERHTNSVIAYPCI